MTIFYCYTLHNISVIMASSNSYDVHVHVYIDTVEVDVFKSIIINLLKVHEYI